MKTTTTEDQFKQLLEQNNAVLFGQFSEYFDKRFDALRDDIKADTDRIYVTVDGIAQCLDTDEKERAAMNAEQERQNEWIAQLAQATGTKLVPEQ